jgi:nucleotide-binding universal stress UspA family protein
METENTGGTFPTKVLLATDGSPDAALAARAAADVAEGAGAELCVVHAWHAVPTARFRAFMRSQLGQIAGEVLEGQVERLEGAGASVADARLVEGRAADGILDLAGELGADLVVLGSRGLGPVAHLALGSVSEAVVHHARCPVLVLRGGEGAWPPRRVVFAEDGSEAARAAGDLAAGICGRHGAGGLLIHAYPRLPEVDAEGRGFDPRAVEDDLRQQEHALLARAKELEGRLRSRPRVRISVGDATAHILRAAQEDAPEATLVALGSRDLDAIGRMRLGSVSTKVLRAAKGPVLVYPPRER